MASTIKIQFDRNKFAARLESERKTAEKAVAEQILADCRDFTPKQEGTLRDTATANGIQEVDGHAACVWGGQETPYAAYQYYGCWPDGSHQIDDSNRTTPGTYTLWTEKAKAIHGKEWEQVAKNAVRKMQK